jgi:RNA polymerase sigma-70 factor (ECF subfamily)
VTLTCLASCWLRWTPIPLLMRVVKPPVGPIQPSDGKSPDLVWRAVAGDREAYRMLFEQHYPRVYRYALARCGDPDAARDISQDVFLAVWNGLPGFAPKHDGSFPAWVFKIAANMVGTYHRSAHRTVQVPKELLPDASFEFEGSLVTLQVLLDALALLPDDQREVLTLRFLVGSPATEVARIMGRSVGAVTALQMRALAKIRIHLGEER